jgi:hypothetical protein
MKKIFVASAFFIFSYSVSAQSVEIWAEGAGNPYAPYAKVCLITFSATNTSNQTINFIQKVNLYDRNRYLISSKDVPFSNLRPRQTGSINIHIENTSCDEISSIVARETWNCKVNGEYTQGCSIMPYFPSKGAMRINR